MDTKTLSTFGRSCTLALAAALALLANLVLTAPLAAQISSPVTVAGVANCLLGQPGFTFNAPNRGGPPTAGGLNLPFGVAL